MERTHCSEYQLELLAAFPHELEEVERAQVLRHLSKCELCEEYFHVAAASCAALERSLKQGPSDKDMFCAAFLLSNICSIFPLPRHIWN
jgi:hypothetical protein